MVLQILSQSISRMKMVYWVVSSVLSMSCVPREQCTSAFLPSRLYRFIEKQRLQHCPLPPFYRDEEGVWRMDYEDMEKKIVDHKDPAAVICNPHNPCGRV